MAFRPATEHEYVDWLFVNAVSGLIPRLNRDDGGVALYYPFAYPENGQPLLVNMSMPEFYASHGGDRAEVRQQARESWGKEQTTFRLPHPLADYGLHIGVNRCGWIEYTHTKVFYILSASMITLARSVHQNELLYNGAGLYLPPGGDFVKQRSPV